MKVSKFYFDPNFAQIAIQLARGEIDDSTYWAKLKAQQVEYVQITVPAGQCTVIQGTVGEWIDHSLGYSWRVKCSLPCLRGIVGDSLEKTGEAYFAMPLSEWEKRLKTLTPL